jgi:hypothetical protein
MDTLPSSSDSQLIVYPTYRAVRYWIDTSSDYETWLAGLTGNTRQSINRKRRKLVAAAQGTLEVRRYASSESILEFHSLARQVSRTTFHEKKLGMGLPDSQRFQVEMHDLAAEGTCFGSIMFFDSTPISYIYCVMRGRRCEPLFRGFDPRCKQWSPGLVHHVWLIEEAFRDPDTDFFDFGLTEFQYKQQLATDQEECVNVLVLSKTLRHRIAVRLHRTMVQLTRRINGCSEALGVKQSLRKWLRGAA